MARRHSPPFTHRHKAIGRLNLHHPMMGTGSSVTTCFGLLLAIQMVLALAASRPLAAQQTSASPTTSAALDLLPVPSEIEVGEGVLALGPNFTIGLLGSFDPRLERAAQRLLDRLEDFTGMPLPADAVRVGDRTATLLVDCAAPGQAVQSIDEDESYRLEVEQGQARLHATTTVGAIRGFVTISQLASGSVGRFFLPEVRIHDRPRFAWRGLLIDSGRHWLPVDVILRNLDGMEAAKLNVLHWHLTEDQGFRLESLRFPRLHQEGSQGDYYTQDQVREVVSHARDRGIRVVPELDMPGHTTSWLVGHPELAGRREPFEPTTTYGVQDPAFDPTLETTYEFIDKLLEEIVPLFPDAYFHIGGDEVNGRYWKSRESIQRFMREHGIKDHHDLQLYFNDRVSALLQKHGRKLAGWDEILHPELPRTHLVQSWRGAASLVEAASRGHATILSSGYYLDHIRTAEYHYLVDPHTGTESLASDQQALILGGEACMWSELVTPGTIDSRIWPRLLAIAERFWSPEGVRDVDDLYRRMAIRSQDLERLGLRHEANYQPMLDRLAGGSRILELRVLADMLQPVKMYQRHGMHQRDWGRRYQTSTPLNRLVDATTPESLVAREFAKQVEDFLGGDPTMEKTIEHRLTAWRDQHQPLVAALAASPSRDEIEPLSRALSEAASLGLTALGRLGPSPLASGGLPAAKDLVTKLDELEAPKSEVQLQLGGIRRLVEAALKRLDR